MSDNKTTKTKSGAGWALMLGGLWAVAVLGLWIAFGAREKVWDLGIFIGRFHLILVHFPIALLPLAWILEFLGSSRRRANLRDAATPVLWFAALGAVAATLVGYVYMSSELTTGWTMNVHLWTGLGVCVMAFVSLILKITGANRGIYMAVLTLTVGLVGVSSHMGGKMVHGGGAKEDFMVEHAPAWMKSLLGIEPEVEVEVEVDPNAIDIGSLVIYDEVIQPIFDAKCVECHSEEKTKGKLRMDSFEELAKGGDIGEEFVPGDVEKSELHYRVSIDSDDDDFMPPGDSEPLTPEEIALLAWWIESGASPTMTVAEAEPSPDLLAAVEQIAKGEELVEEPIVLWRDLTPEDQVERIALATAAAEEIGFSIMPLSAEDSRLRVNVINCADSFGDEQLLRLEPVASNIAWADFGKSQITDAGMKQIGRMIELERLHLENTKVTDAGLGKLTRLQKLNYLNLYGAEITDAGLKPLQSLSKLRKLYLWQTKVTPEGKREFERAVNLEINIGAEVAEPVKSVEGEAPPPADPPKEEQAQQQNN